MIIFSFFKKKESLSRRRNIKSIKITCGELIIIRTKLPFLSLKQIRLKIWSNFQWCIFIVIFYRCSLKNNSLHKKRSIRIVDAYNL
jgi:hypothetical protein